MLLLIGALLIPLLSLKCEADPTKIKSIQIIFRHGERPVERTWPATSQLTEKGKKQMYDLGLYIRERYGDILSTTFDPKELQITSSDIDRVIISGNLVAAGIYNNNVGKKSGEIHPDFSFDPVPLKTIPRDIDRYLNHNFKCPKMLQLFSSSVAVFLGQSSQVDENIANFINMTTKGKPSLPSTSIGFNHTNIDEVPLNGYAMAAFVTIFSNYINALNIPTEACKLYGGSLLGWIRDGFIGSHRKMILYAAHDLPIYTIMKLLDIYDPSTLENPPFGSALIFELHEDSQQRELIKILYRNSTISQPHHLQFQACGNPCLLSNFIQKTQEFIPNDYQKECALS